MNYQSSFNKARDRVRVLMKDPSLSEKIAEKKGTVLKDGTLSIPYMGNEYLFDVSIGEKGEFRSPELKMSRKILLLHYVATGWETLEDPNAEKSSTVGIQAGPPGRWTAFADLPGAHTYKPTYRKRGPLRIIGRYGANPEALLEFSGEPWFVPGDELSGAEKYGDLSIGVKTFPRIPVLVVLYRGDDEFPPEGNILFGKDVLHHLPLEDVAVLAGEIASHLRC
jgi:hypothetical protein